MKKKLFLLLILFLPLNVYATSGWLQKASIKTCPDGITYGKHTDHWHVAVTNGDRYWSSGDAISSDPCPSSNTNQGTAGSTSSSGSSTSSSSGTSSSSSSNISSSNYSSSSSSNTTSNNSSNTYNSSNSPETNSIDNTSVEETSEIIEEIKSSNTSIKTISINGKKINKISNNMNYTIYKKTAKIKVKLEDDKATYKIVGNKNKIINKSKIEIVVSAEDGSTKTYYLNITRKSKKSTTQKVRSSNTSIKTISINGKKINKISNNMDYTIYKKTAKIKVKLEDDKATYKIVGNKNKIINKSKIKIIVRAEDDTKKTYYLNITRKSTKDKTYIKEFIFGAGKLDFDENNYAEAQILNNEHSFEYSYKLSSNNATLKIYKNGKEITKFNNVNNGDIYKIVLSINDNEINEYTFKIIELSKFVTILVYIISIIVMILPVVFIVCLIKHLKKRS